MRWARTDHVPSSMHVTNLCFIVSHVPMNHILMRCCGPSSHRLLILLFLMIIVTLLSLLLFIFIHCYPLRFYYYRHGWRQTRVGVCLEDFPPHCHQVWLSVIPGPRPRHEITFCCELALNKWLLKSRNKCSPVFQKNKPCRRRMDS